MVKKTTVGFWLDVIPGLLGLFGIGEVYLDKRPRGEAFLVWTAGLYMSVFLSFTFTGLSYYWGFLPIAWGLGYFILLVDISRITRRS